MLHDPDTDTKRARTLFAGAAVLLAVAVLFAAGGGDRSAASPAARCEAPRTSGSSHTEGAGGLMFPVTLDQMTDESDIVFVGTVRQLQSCLTEGANSIVTRVDVAPEQVLKIGSKGVGDAPPVTLTIPGGDFGGYTLEVGTSPEFTAGERVVVFARSDGTQAIVPSQGFQSKLVVSDADTVLRPDLTLDHLRDKVIQANHGRLAREEDPLVVEGTNIVESQFATLGCSCQLSTSSIPLPFFVNPNTNRPPQLTAQQTRVAAANAYHAWQNVATAFVAFGPFQNTSRTSGSPGCSFGGPDGFFDTTWGIANSHSTSTLATTYTCFSGSAIIDADVEVDTDHFGADWTVDGSGTCFSSIDLQTVLLHEYGHLLGLGHPPSNGGGCVPCPVMDASYGGLQHTPCADDASGASALYPLAGGSPPAAPSGVTATPGAAIVLNWGNVSSEMGFEIWRAAESCATASAGDFTLLDSVDNDVLTYTDDDYDGGLPAGQTYCYKLRSFNTNGDSAFSATAQAGSSSSPSPTPSSPPTPSLTPTSSPTPTVSPTPSLTPKPTATATATPTPTMTVTPSPAPTATATPTGTPAPAPSPPQAPTPTPEPALAGDVDCSGGIDAVDALLILRLVANLLPSSGCAVSTDVDCDGDTDAVDALAILRHVAKLPSFLGPNCPPIGTALAA